MSLRVGIGNIRIQGGSGTPWSYQNGLLLDYAQRSGLDMLEEYNGGANLDAKILPACGYVNASNYLSRTQANFGGGDATGFMEWKGEVLAADSTIYMLCAGDAASSWGMFQIAIRAGYPSVWCANAGGAIYHRVQTKQKVAAGFHTIRLTADGSTWKFFIDGTEDTSGWTISNGSNAGLWFSLCNGSTDNVTIGCFTNVTTTYTSTAHRVISVNYNDTNKWEITGSGKYAYDVIGSSNMTWTGAAHIAYSLNATQYLFNSGYSLYTKAGEADEHVPYAATPIAGYSLSVLRAGSLTRYNGAPSLIDFDYNNTGSTLLAFFKKDNSTVFIATGSMDYYDAAEVYRWRQDELLDPRIYSDEYKKAGYKGTVMHRTIMSGTDITAISGILAYGVDKKENEEWLLAKYCGLDSIVTKLGSVAVYDADGYIIWV